MSYLELLSARAWEHLVRALVHTLWQGALIALVMSVVLRRMPARAFNSRYLVALAAQLAVLLAWLLTWSVLDEDRGHTAPHPEESEVTAAIAPPAGLRSTATTMARPPGIRQAHGAGERPGWVPILAAVWLVGVGLMLTRTIASVLAASRLANGTRVTDPTILAVLEQTRLELRIGRLIKVCAAGAEYGPAVIGAIWPTLVIPASILTGLPTESLRLIMIHELAHVRRYDYLVNVAQLLIEAILFFNPAVWWIGRQVRLEREACCDRAVVRLTGRPLEYSRSLAECAGRSRVPGIALSCGGSGRSSALLERIRRLLSPAESPGAVISFSGLLLLLVAGPLLLLALRSGAKTAVSLAAQVISPKERVERVNAARAEYRPQSSFSGAMATLKGTMQTPGGELPARPITFCYLTEDAWGNSAMKTIGRRFQRDFSIDVPSGLVWLWLSPPDYALTVVGPFDAAPGKSITGIRIVLDAGFPARIRVTDERGEPVASARVAGALDIGGRSVGIGSGSVTDPDGIATIHHAVSKPYRLSAEAPGFQAMEPVVMTPVAERTLSLVLKHAQLTRGVAVDPAGRPVAAAAVRILHRQADLGDWGFSDTGPAAATTDAAGRFTLDTLVDDSIYTISVTSKGGTQRLVQGIRPGQEGIRVTVGSGKIELNRPVPASPKRKVILRLINNAGGGPVSGRIKVHTFASIDELRVENGETVYDAPVPSQVWIEPGSLVGYWFAEKVIDVKPGEGAQTIEIPVIPAGAIVGHVLDAEGHPTWGGVSLSYVTVEAPPGLPKGSIRGMRDFAVGSQGRFFISPLPLGGAYVVFATRGHNRQIALPVKLDAANPTARVDLRLSRTVVAVGRIVGVDGKPLAGIPVSLRLEQPTASGSWGPPTPTDHDGRFRFDDLSVEFAADYRVSVESRKGYQPAESALNPGGSPVEIRLEAGHDITGRVVDDATGRPIPGVELYAHPLARRPGERYAYEAESRSDRAGRFRFSNLPLRSLQLNDRNGLIWKAPDKSLSIESDRAKPIEIRASLPGWSKLNPVAPAPG